MAATRLRVSLAKQPTRVTDDPKRQLKGGQFWTPIGGQISTPIDTGGVPHALVQGVVDPFVWLADQPHPIVPCPLNGRQGAILRVSLHDQMLDAWMRLRGDAGDGFADGRFRIANSGNNRDFQPRVLGNTRIAIGLHETGLGRNA